MFRVRTIIAACLTLWSMAAHGEPTRYVIDIANSTVSYTVPFGPDKVAGTMPVVSADILLDFVQNARSSVSVVINAAGATANFAFAEQALKGPKVLDTAAHPKITFQSSAIRMETDEADVDGRVTIRGVTRPVRLNVKVFRQQGTEAGDLSKIAVHITGAVRRSDFGATGWDDMVGDVVTILVVARLERG